MVVTQWKYGTTITDSTEWLNSVDKEYFVAFSTSSMEVVAMSVCRLNDKLGTQLITTISGQSNAHSFQCDHNPIDDASLFDQGHIYCV